MININDTTRQYFVNPKSLIGDAFDIAYSRFADAQPASPPDTATMVCADVSMLLIIIVFILTANRYPDESTIWYVLCVAALILAAYITRKYLKARTEYLSNAGKPSTINKKRDAFFALFDNYDAFPEAMPSSELLSIITKLMGSQSKQGDIITNTALRSVHDSLASTNNPSLPLCKLVTPLNKVFTQSKRRLYCKINGSDISFIDDSWNPPLGEIAMTMDDIVSYGRSTAYPAGSFVAGAKVKDDSYIIEAKDDSNHIFFEFMPREFEKLRRSIPSRKEIK